MKRILVTGGAGYIGSHTCVELLAAGYEVCVVDNYSNSSLEAVKRVERISGKSVKVYNFDLRDKTQLDALFAEQPFDAVIHFAGFKAVGESVQQPLLYYQNNIESTLTLYEIMQKHGVKQLIFSSSATVYGDPAELPLRETSRVGVGITNPYGQTKFMIEQILRDISTADPAWQITILRYFNPVGAHESGLIGEDPSGIPNNLLPYVAQVAVGKHDKVRVFGGDYDTPDGTCIRDFIHVVDLAKGHVAALAHPSPLAVYNLGTGVGTSVLQIIAAFGKAAGKPVPYEIVARRPGDIPVCYADPAKANTELAWHATKTIQDVCTDAWRWQSANPTGYR
jgi:UDP-glucose 4-epimerase